MIKLALIFCTMLLSYKMRAQSPAEILADKIAQRMKDSLSLSTTEKTQLFLINLQLNQEKRIARQQFAGSDSLSIKIQRVENKRDSLYNQVLNNEQYQLYIQKKQKLIHNN